MTLLLALLSGISVGAPNDADPNALVKGNTAFAFDLYGQLRGAEGNVFLSPYSISTALAMTYGGARGNTARQMAEVLHFHLDGSRLHGAFKALTDRMRAVEKAGSVHLKVANALWPQAGYPFRKEFMDLVETAYDSTVTAVDYDQGLEEARTRINGWVEEKTERKIRDLIPPGTPLTRLVLVNAIYFKATWAYRFDRSFTQERPFYPQPGKPVSVPMMVQKHRFQYGESGELQVLELPYAGHELAMIVLLPRKRDGLNALEALLNPKNLERWLSTMDERDVEVFLPRCKLTSTFELSQPLQSLGMTEAFRWPGANFSGMDGSDRL